MPPADSIVIIGSKDFLSGLNQDYKIVEIPYDKSACKPGYECKESGEFSYQCLKKPVKWQKWRNTGNCHSSGIKNALHLAGHNFSGQTEIIEKELANPEKKEKAEMLFVSKRFTCTAFDKTLTVKRRKNNKKSAYRKS